MKVETFTSVLRVLGRMSAHFRRSAPWPCDPGQLFLLLSDPSLEGCYCNDVELQLILNKLVAAPKKKETKKRLRGYVCRCFAKVSWFTDVNDT